MRRIVFDIETVGNDFEQLDKITKDYFLRFADTPKKEEEARQSLSFYPLTAQIVAIAMIEVETQRGGVFFQNGCEEKVRFREDNIHYLSGTEADILNWFWKHISRYEKFVTFNGRVFDCPFIAIRSAINGIPAKRCLVPYRYSFEQHVDLADQLSFYDAMRRKFNLHMWCQAFGIKSSKEDGIEGLMVKDYYLQGKYLDIARYCLRDVEATKELFFNWEKHIKI